MDSIEWQHVAMIVAGLVVYIGLALRVRFLCNRINEIVVLLTTLTSNVDRGLDLLERTNDK